MSATRTLRKALVRFGSGGVVSVTVGLSSVGPPPSLRMSHVLATFMITGSRSISTVPPKIFLWKSRERSWSETTRKCVMTKPSLGAGKSSGFISSSIIADARAKLFLEREIWRTSHGGACERVIRSREAHHDQCFGRRGLGRAHQARAGQKVPARNQHEDRLEGGQPHYLVGRVEGQAL